MTRACSVTFEPPGVTVEVPTGSCLLDAARAAGVVVPAACGGRGICGSCSVRVVDGALEDPDDAERRGLTRAPEGIRLACRAKVVGDVVVRPLAPMGGASLGVDARLARDGEPGVGIGHLVAGVDLGTSTVAALVASADSGAEVARAVVVNRQQSLGADVATRISAAIAGEGPALAELAEESIAAALTEACTSAGLSPAAISGVVIAGNSAMSGLLLRADMGGLAAHPFRPPVTAPAELGTEAVSRIGLARHTSALVMPAIAGFVGGDAIAVLMSSGLVPLPAEGPPVLIVDIGTNAEVLLVTDGSLFVASAAAGPAFEGTGIACGGPAVAGAVEAVSSTGGAVTLQVIGGVAPLWLCGAGLLSALSMLRVLGHLDEGGLLRDEGPLSARFSRDDDGVLGCELGAAGAGCLRIDQRDVRALQLAKGAVHAAVGSVLERAGVQSADVSGVLVAGAFGAALDPGLLASLGVLPASLARRAVMTGNAALEGALALALVPTLVGDATRLVEDAVHIDLAAEPGFGKALMGSLELRPYE